MKRDYLNRLGALALFLQALPFHFLHPAIRGEEVVFRFLCPPLGGKMCDDGGRLSVGVSRDVGLFHFVKSFIPLLSDYYFHHQAQKFLGRSPRLNRCIGVWTPEYLSRPEHTKTKYRKGFRFLGRQILMSYLRLSRLLSIFHQYSSEKPFLMISVVRISNTKIFVNTTNKFVRFCD